MTSRRGSVPRPFGAAVAFGLTVSARRPRDSFCLRRRAAGWTHATAWCWSSVAMTSYAAMRSSMSRRCHEVELAGRFAVRCTACCLYPYPAASLANQSRECPGGNTGWLEPGRTTLADTFFRLGEPDDYAADRRTLGWVNINRLGGGVLIFAAGGSAAAAAALGESFRRLVVQFDDNGVVTNRWMESDACISGFWGIGNASEE